MAEVSTIQLDKRLIGQLRGAKEYSRQTYSELIGKMLKIFVAVGSRNQYDEFLHKIQQPKMKELWDNKVDEAWENV